MTPERETLSNDADRAAHPAHTLSALAADSGSLNRRVLSFANTVLGVQQAANIRYTSHPDGGNKPRG